MWTLIMVSKFVRVFGFGLGMTFIMEAIFPMGRTVPRSCPFVQVMHRQKGQTERVLVQQVESHKRSSLIGVHNVPFEDSRESFGGQSCAAVQKGHCSIKRNRGIGHHFKVQAEPATNARSPLAMTFSVSQHLSGVAMHMSGSSGVQYASPQRVASGYQEKRNSFSGAPSHPGTSRSLPRSFENSASSSDNHLLGIPGSRQSPVNPNLRLLYTANIELAPGGRFVVKFSGYHVELMNLIKSIPGGTMEQYSKGAYFSGEHYKAVLETLHSANNNLKAVELKVVDLGSIPQKVMLAASKLHDDSDRYSKLSPKLASSLHQFQTEGIKCCLRNGGRLLIGDEMGLGKTVQALSISQCYADKWPVLVVTSSSLREQWAAEIVEWLEVPEEKIEFLQSTKPPYASDASFVIGSYENVSKLVDKIKGMFDILILDESHMIKTPTSVRSRACVALAQKCSHVVLLSGTPVTSRPFELYTQIKAVLPGAKLTQNEFSDQYCGGDYYSKNKGSRNEEELNLLLSSTIMVRRLKKNVLAHLGSKQRKQVYISLSQENKNRLKSIKKKLDSIGAADSSLSSIQMSQATIENHKRIILNELFHESAKAKIQPVQEYVSNLLSRTQEKLLVFGHHKEMLDGIEQILNRKNVGYVRIDGGTHVSKREQYKTHFQNDDSIRVAILAIKAAGVGLNLTAAQLVLFAELSWVPGDIKQCEDRAHRIGQKHLVNVQFLLAKESIDDIIWRTIQNKLENVGQVLDGDQEILEVGKRHVVPDPSQSSLDQYLTFSQRMDEYNRSSHKRSLMSFNDSGSKRNKP